MVFRLSICESFGIFKKILRPKRGGLFEVLTSNFTGLSGTQWTTSKRAERLRFSFFVVPPFSLKLTKVAMSFKKFLTSYHAWIAEIIILDFVYFSACSFLK